MGTKHYDYIVIGGGSGGIASANRAALHGKSCALIEAGAIGGTCVNVGCVPKKVMWYAAQIAEAIHRYGPDYGFDTTVERFDWERLLANRSAYIERIHASYHASLARNKVDVVHGFARLSDARTVEVNGERLTADHILIATGTRPARPRIPGAEYGRDSDQFFALPALPRRTAVVGAGYIAVELAGVLHALGSQTHLFIRHETPLRHFDPMLCETLVQVMEADGPTLHRHAAPRAIVKNADGSLTLQLDNGQSHVIDCVVWAIGRKPDTSGLRACSMSFHDVRCPAKTADARRKPQTGWWPGEDLQRRRCCLGGATLRARQPTAALVVAHLDQATSLACGTRLDCGGWLPCGHHEKTLNTL